MYYLLYLPGNYLAITLRESLLILRFSIYFLKKKIPIYIYRHAHIHTHTHVSDGSKKGERLEKEERNE